MFSKVGYLFLASCWWVLTISLMVNNIKLLLTKDLACCLFVQYKEHHALQLLTLFHFDL